MPCSSYGEDEWYQKRHNAIYNFDLDTVTRLLCSVLSVVDLDSLTISDDIRTELTAWKMLHELNDKKIWQLPDEERRAFKLKKIEHAKFVLDIFEKDL